MDSRANPREAESGRNRETTLNTIIHVPVAALLALDITRLNIPIPAELLPTDVRLVPHHQVGLGVVQTQTRTPLLPPLLHGQRTQHNSLGTAHRRSTHGITVAHGVDRGGVEQRRQHAHATVGDLLARRILVRIDKVDIERVHHQLTRLVLHVRRDEAGQIQNGAGIDLAQVLDDLVHNLTGNTLIRHDALRDRLRHSTRGERRIHKVAIRRALEMADIFGALIGEHRQEGWK